MNVILYVNIHNECIFEQSPFQAMRLTQWTDYTLRVLMYCAANLARPQPYAPHPSAYAARFFGQPMGPMLRWAAR